MSTDAALPEAPSAKPTTTECPTPGDAVLPDVILLTRDVDDPGIDTESLPSTASKSTSFKTYSSFPVDDNVLADFPAGTNLVSATSFGKSAWTVTARLHVQYPEGEDGHFFLKTADGDHGHTLMEGEFNAMSELYKTAPHMIPKPHSFGEYGSSDPPKYYFLSEFVPMFDKLPEPRQLCAKLAKLHTGSESPTGKFGFPITTCQGRIPQSVSWEETWTIFFTRLLQHVIDLDAEANGDWDGLKTLGAQLISHVVPRLLDTLSSDGRVLKPSLIHGDLWEGNTGISRDNGNIYVFDAAAFYAHNEMEIGNWRCYYNQISSRVYTETYHKYNPPSEPVDEWEDRNRLYSIYYNVIYSVNHMDQGTAVRQL